MVVNINGRLVDLAFSNEAVFKIVWANIFVLPEDIHHTTLSFEMLIFNSGKLIQLKHKYLCSKANYNAIFDRMEFRKYWAGWSAGFHL